jgi:hypothetical protein
MNENSPTNPLERVRTLTFDIFGTVLNLAGSLVHAMPQKLSQVQMFGHSGDIDNG